jgi:hypothetical protein
LEKKREKLRAEPQLADVSRTIAGQLDCPAPQIDAHDALCGQHSPNVPVLTFVKNDFQPAVFRS